MLLVDALLAPSWSGSDGEDYDRACTLLMNGKIPGASILVGTGSGILWDIQGPGTVDVYSNEQGHFVLVRVWLDDAEDEQEMLSKLARLPMQQHNEVGLLNITSGVLAIIWAAEAGQCVHYMPSEHSFHVMEEETATGESVLLVTIPKGTYSCLVDEISIDDNKSIRLHLIPSK